ncbi:MAG: hypothetical protein QNJ97_07470 [Myxococcota bacterium]|nr:hypothetical protein [Myxococcota bacterium]
MLFQYFVYGSSYPIACTSVQYPMGIVLSSACRVLMLFWIVFGLSMDVDTALMGGAVVTMPGRC